MDEFEFVMQISTVHRAVCAVCCMWHVAHFDDVVLRSPKTQANERGAWSSLSLSLSLAFVVLPVAYCLFLLPYSDIINIKLFLLKIAAKA